MTDHRPYPASRALRAWLCAVGVALLLPSSASSATWTTVANPAFPDSYRAFQDTYGGAIAWFSPAQRGGIFAWTTTSPPDETSASTLLALRDDGTLGAEIQAPGVYLGATADASGETTALLTGLPKAGADPDRYPPGVLWRRYGRSGELAGSGQLSTGQIAIRPTIQANSRGDMLVVWVEGKRGKFRLRAATRQAGTPVFGPPVTLGSDPTSTGLIAADVSDDGRLLVAYEGSLRGTTSKPKPEAAPQMAAWTGTIGGGFTPRQSIGRRDPSTSVAAAFDGRGRGYVVWQGSGRGVSTPQLVSLPPGARSFSEPVDLDPRRPLDSEPVLAVNETGGGALVAWARDAPYPAYAATISAAGQVTARQQLGRGLPLTAATADGVAAVAVDVGDARTRFAVRERGSKRFGALERPGKRALYADSIRLLVEPDGALRVTSEITDQGGQPRVLTLRRSAR